jgi:hypothetical protein
MRVVIIKGNLLISIYPLNLALLGGGAVLGVVFIIWKRRLSVVSFRLPPSSSLLFLFSTQATAYSDRLIRQPDS